MAPRSWKLIGQIDKATQTMPLEWLKPGWRGNSNEENERKRSRGEVAETKRYPRFSEEIEIAHLETGEETVGDTLEEAQRRTLEIYEEEICEQDL